MTTRNERNATILDQCREAMRLRRTEDEQEYARMKWVRLLLYLASLGVAIWVGWAVWGYYR